MSSRGGLNLLISVHNTFKIGLERILPLLNDPPSNDLPNFLGYCETWAAALAGHHDSEGARVVIGGILKSRRG